MKKILVILIAIMLSTSTIYAQTLKDKTQIDKQDLERISYALENVREDTNYTLILWEAEVRIDESDIGVEMLRNDYDYEFEGVKYWIYENIRVGLKAEGDIVKVIVRKR